MLENLFDVLCFVVQNDDCKKQFIAEEGLELMMLIIDSRRDAYHGALKVLDTCLAEDPEACARLIELGGLKTIFPVLVWRGFTKKQNKNKRQDTERVVTLLHTLATQLTGVSLDRFYAKFVENNFEKTDRLIELHCEYSEHVAIMLDKNNAAFDNMDPDDVCYHYCMIIIRHTWRSWMVACSHCSWWTC